MRILLISPSSEDDVLSHATNEVPFLGAAAFFAPHSLAAVAALTPPSHEVFLHDEALHGSIIPRFGREAFDVVGISLKATQLERALSIARAFRRMRAPGALVLGGIGATYMLQRLRDLADTIFYGEAEETWPEYLRDLEQGQPKAAYARAAKPDMSTVPPPRWELVAADLPEYLAASVQTTRGCHHDCAFCDVIYTFGRVPRVKSTAQVLDEVRRLQRLGVKMVYFADDNFCVNKAKTKAFLGELAEVNNGFEAPLGFITQIDISVAADDELLELLADCNFMELQIGIESTNPAALEDLNKRANAMVDLVDAVKKIQSHAMVVMAHMIIGADSDDASAFQRTLDFVDEANVVHHFCHPLAAPPGTRLWYQLRREGRLVAPAVDNLTRGEMVNNVDVLTNIIPRRMTRVELFEGVAECWKRGHELAGFHARARRFIDGIDRIPKVKRLGAADAWRNRAMLASTLGHFLFGVTSEHRRAFFDLAARAGRRDPSLVQRMIFAFSNFIMERARALASARRALAQAAWERDHPELLTTLRRSTPLPHKIRQNAKQIFETAYNCVRQEVHDRETLYRTVIDAVIDYTDRFGDSFETLDDRHRAYISDSCEYVLAGLDSTAPSDEPSSLHTSRLPRGFVREILDGVDRTLRLRESSLDHGAMRKVP